MKYSSSLFVCLFVTCFITTVRFAVSMSYVTELFWEMLRGQIIIKQEVVLFNLADKLVFN